MYIGILIVMQCPLYEGIRTEMCNIIKSLDDQYILEIFLDPLEVFYVIMGKYPA